METRLSNPNTPLTKAELAEAFAKWSNINPPTEELILFAYTFYHSRYRDYLNPNQFESFQKDMAILFSFAYGLYEDSIANGESRESKEEWLARWQYARDYYNRPGALTIQQKH